MPRGNGTTTHSVREKDKLLTPVIWCILVTETGERFAYFGFRAILVLYFVSLEYSESQAIAFFAYTTCLAYLSPIAGALLADGHLGRYQTILWFGLVYVIGLSILTFAAAASEDVDLAYRRTLTFVGLFLVCLGTGGIKPCVSAFGADQISMRPEDYDDGDDTLERSVNNAGPVAMTSTKLYRDNHKAITLADTGQGPSERDGLFREPPVDPRETVVAPDGVTSSKKNEQVRAFFAYFYFCINVGAVTSIALVPILRGRYGFSAAFLLPTCFMITAILLFLSKRNEYIHHQPGKDGSSLSTTFRLCWWLIRENLWSIPWVQRALPWAKPEPLQNHAPGQHTLVPNEEDDYNTDMDAGLNDNTSSVDDDTVVENDTRASPDAVFHQQLDDAAQAVNVLPIMAMFPIFWCLYDQQGSVWTLQATRMALPDGMLPEQLQVVNPLQIMLFIPLFDRYIYPVMQAKGWNIAPLRRMSWGMMLTAISFFLSGLVEWCIQSHERNSEAMISVFWQLPQITVLAIGEIFISVTGLEFAYSTSPERLKAFLMALFLLTTAFGDLLSGILYSTVFANMNRAKIMHTCALLMLCNLGLFALVVRWWERREVHHLRRLQSLQGLELREERRMI